MKGDIKLVEKVYVGKKPLVKYVMTIIGLMSKENIQRCVVMARGALISRAVDICNRVTKHCPHIHIGSIKIGSQMLESDGKERLVSEIAIELVKAN